MEQYVRTKINNQLANLGWYLTGATKNVFQEEPRTRSEKSSLKGKRPDYVLYSTDINRIEPLAIIETKSTKNIGLDGAIEQGAEYAYKLNAPIVFATDGVFYKTLHTKTNSPLSLNGEYVDTLIKETIALQFLTSNELDLRPKKIQTSLHTLIQNFKSINEILRKQGLTAGYERFSEFATILFLKLFSEKERLKAKPKVSEIYTWDYLKNLPQTDWLNYISKSIFPEIEKIYKDEDIFTQNLKTTSPTIFKEIYDKLNPLELTYINEDVKGAAFEYFLANSPSSDKDLGEYFTPRHIVRTMVKLIDPQIGEKIYDPFCGTGGMLIESYRHIEQNMEQTKENLKQLKTDTLFGRDITANARIAKMNMILAGDGHSNIKQIDSLSPANLKDVENKFDVVITNFPFAQSTDWQKFYDIPSNNGDSICLQHCLKALKDGGRMAIVVPEGVMFRDTNDLIKTRNLLLDNCVIENIISLPAGVFEPYTNVETHIIHCVKSKKKQKKVWFYEVKNDGYSLDKLRTELKERNDLDKFLSFRNVMDEDKRKFGFTDILINDIRENKSILLAKKYRNSITEQDNFVELNEVLKRSKNPIDIDDKTEYKRVTIALYGKGCSLRDTKQGKFIGTKRQFRIKQGQFLLSKIDARNGAFGFVSAEIDNAIITGNFWAYDINTKIAEPEYLAYLFSTSKFMKYCSDKSGGVTNRKYLDENAFLKVKIPLPTIAKQKQILDKIRKQKELILHAEQQINDIRNNLENEWEQE